VASEGGVQSKNENALKKDFKGQRFQEEQKYIIVEDIVRESSQTERILNSEIHFDYQASPTGQQDLRFDANISQDSNLCMLKGLKQELAGEYNLLDSIDRSLAKRRNGPPSKNKGDFLQMSQEAGKFFQNDQFDLTQKYDEGSSGAHNDSMKSLNNLLNHNQVSPSFLFKQEGKTRQELLGQSLQERIQKA